METLVLSLHKCLFFEPNIESSKLINIFKLYKKILLYFIVVQLYVICFQYEPLDWRELDVTGLAYSFPYILAMSGDKISMYRYSMCYVLARNGCTKIGMVLCSMLDKQKKQTIQFQVMKTTWHL